MGQGQDFWRPAKARSNRTSAGFSSRPLFGIDVEQRLRRAISRSPDVRVVHLRSTGKSVRRSADGFEVLLNDNAVLRADFVILATGYGRPESSGRFGRLPFADLDPAEARAATSALFIGTGLTFVDEFVRLRSLGFRGEAIAVSRRGLTPQVHRADAESVFAGPFARGRSRWAHTRLCRGGPAGG